MAASLGGAVEIDRRTLTRSPLVNAVWQLRFTTETRLADGRAAMNFQSALKHNTSLMPVTEGGPSASRQTASVEVKESAWRLTATDSSAAVTIAPGVITLETGNYGSWEANFQPWIWDILTALSESLDPGLTTRIGLRYVNALFGAVVERDDFASPDDLAGLVHPALLGFGADAGSPEVLMLQGRQVLTTLDAQVTLNHALVQADDGESGMIIDVDAYLEEAIAFDLEAVAAASERIHDAALSVFQRCLTSEAWDAMGPMERKAEGGDS